MSKKIHGLALVVLAGCTVQYRTHQDPPRQEAPRPVARPVSGQRVRVALFRAVVTPDLAKTVKAEKLNQMWRNHFVGDRRIALVAQGHVDKAQRDEQRGRYNFFRLGDAVRVHCVASHKMVTGIHRKTRKLTKMPVLVLTATVEHKVANTKKTFSVQGSFFQNAQLLADLAQKVKRELR